MWQCDGFVFVISYLYTDYGNIEKHFVILLSFPTLGLDSLCAPFLYLNFNNEGKSYFTAVSVVVEISKALGIWTTEKLKTQQPVI